MGLQLVSDEKDDDFAGSCLEDLQMISEGIAAIDIILNRMNLTESRIRCQDLKDSINCIILEFENFNIKYPNVM